MLVLSRREGESIVIGNDIVVTIVEVRGGQVRVGVEAPRSVAVHREEVYRQVAEDDPSAVDAAMHVSEPMPLRSEGQQPAEVGDRGSGDRVDQESGL